MTLLLALFTLPAQAGDHPALPDHTKVGVGIEMELLSQLGYLGYVDPSIERIEPTVQSDRVRVPILLSTGLRIEPALQLMKIDADGDEVSSTGLSCVVGKNWRVSPAGSAYAGGRLGAMMTKYDHEDSTDLSAGGVAGGEYWIAPSFSFGGEVELMATQFDDDIDATSVYVGSSLLLRFYFN